VERDSVNSVALCDDTQSAATTTNEQFSPRVMVAANVHLNPFGNAYTARDTTIMPPIPALLAIIAVTFSPNAELRFVVVVVVVIVVVVVVAAVVLVTALLIVKIRPLCDLYQLYW